MYDSSPLIFKKHDATGLVTTYSMGESGCKTLCKVKPLYYGTGAQGSPEFIGPRNQLHQALFDLGQLKRQMQS